MPKDSLTVTTSQPDLITSSTRFFALILGLLSKIEPGYRTQNVNGTIVSTRLVEIGQDYQQFIAENFPGNMTTLPLKTCNGAMNLYRESGADPISGCFPILIQLPFLIGMFGLLKTSFALRGASFIPGWIDDLSAPDVLFSWKTPIFFIGNSFHLLPFFLAVSCFYSNA